MAYSVTQRTHEIGVRMALGAQQTDVLVMVMRRGMAMTAAGLFIGMSVALVLVWRTLGSTANTSGAGTLLTASVNDPLIYLAAAGFLTGIGAIASYIPARRATKVDPTVALRYE